MSKYYPAYDHKPTREGFGEGLYLAGKENPRVVALAADLSDSIKMTRFKREFPERFFQAGVAEANMVGVAAGLTIGGWIPFAGSFVNFISGRVYDQIRQSVAYSNKNVKLAGSHMGLTLGEDGATHQNLEDLALMRTLPNMTVLSPCDATQTRQATLAAARHSGPVYIRFGRPKWPVFIPEEMPFEIGKAQVLKSGNDVTLIATGHMVWHALLAAEMLEKRGIDAEVINMHTIKPLDREAVLQSVRKTGAAVTAEEHQKAGGLGGAVAEVLGEEQPVPMARVGVNDRFGESGKPEELMRKYGLMPEDIVQAALRVLTRKKP